jgi:hypothetical protein
MYFFGGKNRQPAILIWPNFCHQAIRISTIPLQNGQKRAKTGIFFYRKSASLLDLPNSVTVALIGRNFSHLAIYWHPSSLPSLLLASESCIVVARWCRLNHS